MAVPDWVEYAKLGISAITPIVTGVVGVIILRLGARLEKGKQLNQTLLQKRLSFYEEVAPKLNDIYCFFQVRGHWSDLTPVDMIKHKRSIDRAFHVNRYLLGGEILQEYARFIEAHFELFVRAGQAAKLRLDQPHFTGYMGRTLNKQWLPMISTQMGDCQDQQHRYEALMEALGWQVKGESARA